MAELLDPDGRRNVGLLELGAPVKIDIAIELPTLRRGPDLLLDVSLGELGLGLRKEPSAAGHSLFLFPVDFVFSSLVRWLVLGELVLIVLMAGVGV